MKRYRIVLIVLMVCMLPSPFLEGYAQTVYELMVPAQPMEIKEGHLKMGGTSPTGGNIGFNSYYMSVDGQPVIPVMGEFHFSRYPAAQWEEEILKMKAGGVTIIPTYVFWNLHEEVEGQFRWDGQRDLRRFLMLCKQHGMSVIIRIGPFCHGEMRNGGFPDWIFAKMLEVRSNDPEYLKYVRRLYTEIGQQIQGLLYKDGGPVIGCQIENEMQHSAAPWGICYPGEPKDRTAASYNAAEASEGVGVQLRKATGAELGEQHMRTLKQLAQEAGIITPFYTATGWGNAAVIPHETLPVTAAYPYATWTKPHPSPFLMFKDMQGTPDYSPVRYNPTEYPSFSAEMGAGIQMTYNRRPYCYPATAEAMMVRCLGSGSNGIGYYMYHGGSTPKQTGGVGFLSEEPSGVPKISYDFQAPIGEFGLTRPAYRNLRLIHAFLADFGDRLAPMQTVLPEGWEQMKPENRDSLRYCARISLLNERSACLPGFLFLINAQDHDTLRHDMSDLQIKLRLKNEELTIPARGSFTLPKDQSVILPFNFDMHDALLKYATAQLLMKIDDQGTDHYFFFAPEGMTPEYLFDKATVKGKCLFKPQPGYQSTFSIRTVTGRRIRITTLTRQQALNAVKVNGRLLITDASVLPTADGADLLSLGQNAISYVLYPSSQGFKPQTITVPAVTPQFQVKTAGPRRMSVSLQSESRSNEENKKEAVHELFLCIDYIADVAMAFINGQLVNDHFYYGDPWIIGLKRYDDDLKAHPLTFYFRPLHANAPFLGDLPVQAVPDFSRGPVINIKSVEIIPQYKVNIRF